MLALLLLLTWPNVQAAPTSFGCYESNVRSGYPDLAYLNFRDQAKRGFTTSTVSGNASGHFGPTMQIGLARQVDLMIDAGLLTRRDVPMLCLSADAKDIAGAKQYAQYPDRWPELMLGSVDEPNYTMIKVIRDYSTLARASGVRNGTAIAGYALYQESESAASDGVIADWLDWWGVLASTFSPDLQRKAFEQTADLGAYWAFPRSLEHDRYVAELWCLRWHPKMFLYWAWNHSGNSLVLPDGTLQVDKDDVYSLSYPSLRGPVATPALEAVTQGIRDYNLLYRLQESGRGGTWLKDLLDSVPAAMPSPPKPVPAHPDWKTIRRECERRLRG